MMSAITITANVLASGTISMQATEEWFDRDAAGRLGSRHRVGTAGETAGFTTGLMAYAATSLFGKLSSVNGVRA